MDSHPNNADFSWPLSPIWKDEPCYIIGGGASVQHFDVGALIDYNVIGCNEAYYFGDEVVDLLVFGDKAWYDYHKGESRFQDFTSPKLTNNSKLRHEEGVLWAPRRLSNAKVGETLPWYGNTGAAAIMAGVLLGANPICLLGFDMKDDENQKAHWHAGVCGEPTHVHYERYKESMVKLKEDLTREFPETKVLNMNPDSALDVFPRVTPILWKAFVSNR